MVRGYGPRWVAAFAAAGLMTSSALVLAGDDGVFGWVGASETEKVSAASLAIAKEEHAKAPASEVSAPARSMAAVPATPNATTGRAPNYEAPTPQASAQPAPASHDEAQEETHAASSTAPATHEETKEAAHSPQAVTQVKTTAAPRPATPNATAAASPNSILP